MTHSSRSRPESHDAIEVYGARGPSVRSEDEKTPKNPAPSPLLLLLHVLLPCSCLTCLQPVWRPAASLGLCDRCRAGLRPAAGSSSSASLGTDPVPPPLVWAFDYRPPLDEVIQALKFRRLDYLARQLAVAAAPAARRAAEEVGGVDAVVPVPLHWRRTWQRGYDQAKLLAAGLARELDLPVGPWLRRRRPTPAQSRLDRDVRRRNLLGAFAATRGARAGTRVLLVDDVVTTGSTLESAAGCLRNAGVEVAVAFAVARTPEEEEKEPDRRSVSKKQHLVQKQHK